MMRSEEGDQAIDLNAEPEYCVPCSICLDLVSYDGERSRAKLQCGHEFHLDCIGSAFNIKGKMQCPNCRKVEKGRWLYSSGSTNSSSELSMDDGGLDSYPLYFTFAEMLQTDQCLECLSEQILEARIHCTIMYSVKDNCIPNDFTISCLLQPYRVHICPFRGLAHVYPSSESSIGIMSTLTPMISHQHPGRSPHPHGWVHFRHAPYHHHQQSSGLPMPISNPGRFDTARSLPRYVPSGRVYDPIPNPGFPVYAESISYYSHAWARDNGSHFP
ncbi:hypothetical protein Cgig2_020888 [Carnegiea gigantea]|uniref:RING-type domain-containing protein n=1 Tax=Carnegiea gigantea TaxID=171969 RepID=A0A9Q1QJ13_9CARY|nr:hypothetical protein Cgig2_020888 [Carnegiea gigantea]